MQSVAAFIIWWILTHQHTMVMIICISTAVIVGQGGGGGGRRSRDEQRRFQFLVQCIQELAEELLCILLIDILKLRLACLEGLEEFEGGYGPHRVAMIEHRLPYLASWWKASSSIERQSQRWRTRVRLRILRSGRIGRRGRM